MRQNLTVVITVCAMTLLITSCNRADKGSNIPVPVFSTHHPETPDKSKNVREIYYGLMTPVEVCNIFERLGIRYNDTILLPSGNRDLYMSSYKAAMNLGCLWSRHGIHEALRGQQADSKLFQHHTDPQREAEHA